MTTSFLWPDVDHLSCEQSWVGGKEGSEERETHEGKFEVVIVVVVIQMQVEELVLQEDILSAEESVEQVMSGSNRPSSSEEV